MKIVETEAKCGTKKIAPRKIVPDPNPKPTPNPNPGGNILGAIFRGAILRSPKNVPTPTIPHKMFWGQLTRAGKVSLIADFV